MSYSIAVLDNTAYKMINTYAIIKFFHYILLL